MSEWTRAFEQLAYMLMGNPETRLETGAVLVVSVLVLYFVLNKAGAAFGIPNTGMWYALVVGVLGVAIVMASMIAARLYLPLWRTETLRVWILVGASLIASLLLVIPSMCAIQRTKYLAAMLTWFISLATVALAIVLVGLVFDGIAIGSRSAERGTERTRQVESFTK